MKHQALTTLTRGLALALGTLSVSCASWADASTDGALANDHAGYRAQQDAIQQLNDSGQHPLRSYSLAKAQCWLDVSFHEYTRNDRSAFPAGALTESRKITDYLRQGGAPGAAENPAQQTPLVNDALPLRQDLWAQALSLKAHPGWRCVERLVACAEVELVHAGNEQRQQGWRHAKPYVQIAEDQIGQAREAAQACPPVIVPVVKKPEPTVVTPPPVTPPTPTPVVPVPPVKTEKIVLNASVLYSFDKRTLSDMLPGGKAQLDQVVSKLQHVYARIDKVELVGYTDRLGTEAYNQKLSLDRAESVRQYLSGQGVTYEMVATGRGSADPLVTCQQRSLKALKDCLQPNRRVEILITGVPN